MLSEPSADEVPADDAVDEQLPQPKSALAHVNRSTLAAEAPRFTTTISGVPHPAHRSS